MDQVLVNFLGGAKCALGREFNDPVEFGGKDKWPIIGQMPSFWLDLKWMPNAQKIWDRIKHKDTYILSAIPNADVVPLCAIQKNQWCQRELGISPDRILTVTRTEKKKFARRNGKANLLIDDHYGNADVWSRKGGYAIWHHTVPETLEELNQFGL